MLALPTTTTFTHFTHLHDFHNKTRPPSEMLRPLTGSGFGIILLPREPSPLPFIKYILYQILAKARVHGRGLLLIRAFCGGDILIVLLASLW